MDNQQQMLWMDEDFTAPLKPLTWEEKAQQAEDELAQAKRELTEVRKDLAAKVGGGPAAGALPPLRSTQGGPQPTPAASEGRRDSSSPVHRG
jgi:hypothetical protein